MAECFEGKEDKAVDCHLIGLIMIMTMVMMMLMMMMIIIMIIIMIVKMT